MKISIALFTIASSPCFMELVAVIRKSENDNRADEDAGYIRVTEDVEVDFPLLSDRKLGENLLGKIKFPEYLANGEKK